jgi:hypothetical protein
MRPLADPAQLTADDRRRDVAAVLAAGLRRLSRPARGRFGRMFWVGKVLKISPELP